jgi:hypothetical protein
LDVTDGGEDVPVEVAAVGVLAALAKVRGGIEPFVGELADEDAAAGGVDVDAAAEVGSSRTRGGRRRRRGA